MKSENAQTSATIADSPDESDTDLAAEDPITAFLGRYGRHLALLQATVAVSGSLFMSEVLHWIPCLLCWYQRVLMYPLSALLLIGILRRDRGLHFYILPFSLVGACVSLYHYLLIKTDWIPPPPCLDGVPCTVDYLDILGFINVPFLALTAFLVISFLMGANAISAANASDERPSLRDGQAIAAYAIVALVVAGFVGWGMII